MLGFFVCCSHVRATPPSPRRVEHDCQLQKKLCFQELNRTSCAHFVISKCSFAAHVCIQKIKKSCDNLTHQCEEFWGRGVFLFSAIMSVRRVGRHCKHDLSNTISWNDSSFLFCQCVSISLSWHLFFFNQKQPSANTPASVISTASEIIANSSHQCAGRETETKESTELCNSCLHDTTSKEWQDMVENSKAKLTLKMRETSSSDAVYSEISHNPCVRFRVSHFRGLIAN